MKRRKIRCPDLLLTVCLMAAVGCAADIATKKARQDAFAERARSVQACDKAPKTSPQSITGNAFTLNVKICVTYTGDGPRPLDPRNPTPQEIEVLEAGEVYFVYIVRDSGADMEKVEIVSDVLKKMIWSTETLFDQDIYHGTPTGALDIYIGAFDDDGWPSDRTGQLKTVQKNLGKALEAFPETAIGIPFLQTFFDLIPAVVELIDSDDLLFSGRAKVTKQIDPATRGIKWNLSNPVMRLANGTIWLTINPE